MPLPICVLSGMDVLQVISSATQIISCMVGAVGALEQASRDLDEAPKKIQYIEEFLRDLENLVRLTKNKQGHKLHNPQLNYQIQSLNTLIKQLRTNLTKARRTISKSKIKNVAKVVWSSMAGDPLTKFINSMRNDLDWWLESQTLAQNIGKVIESTAKDTPIKWKIKTDQGYPLSSKCKLVRNLLEKEDSHRVVLIVGLSGIGKSCLARQVASDLPMKFVDGAVELGFGQACCRAACNGSKAEYEKRLARKISRFLVQIGFWKNTKDENSGDLEYVCFKLQEALYGKSILILLDDVWEQDIVQRFANLYDNDSKYLVTTRNEAVYEITEAEKVELSKDDTKEISKAILLYHSLLGEEELPDMASNLLERCGHHPLTVAVMGKALRKETRAEKWEKAISNLSTYAACAPGPVSYVNEKEAENTLTIFGSFEFSLEAMLGESRKFFIALAALCWVEPVPESCLESIWSVLGEESLFPLVVCKLVEGSLLMKTDTDPLYKVHDMVSLYLDGKIDNSVEILLSEPTSGGTAFICPWLLIFGKESIKKIVQKRIEFLLDVSEEELVVITLEAIVEALMASKSISELEASRASFSSIIGPTIADLISANSHGLIATSASAIANIFSGSDYSKYFPLLETSGAVDKLANVLEICDDPTIQANILTVLAKLAEFGSLDIVDKVLQSIPFNYLGELLSLDREELHESVFTILTLLMKAGKSKAVERMFAFEIDKNLIKLLENGSEVVQHHAIVTLKAFYELSGPANGSLRPANLSLFPWQVRLRLERFVLSDSNAGQPSPEPQTFEGLVHKVLESDSKRILEAMQDLIPILENAGDSRVREMIIQSPLVRRLSELLQRGHLEQNSIRSESAFLLMKLACSGGEPFIRKFLEYSIIPELVKMMQCQIAELQDSAYTALHEMLVGNGGVLVLNKIFQIGLVDRIAQSLDSRSVKTREVATNCILDFVELGNKSSLEKMFSLQVVEKLVKQEKASGGSGETMIGFLKGMDKCKHLTVPERRLMKQQAVKKIRTALKGHKFETRILVAVDACVYESSKGSSSGGNSRYRK